VQSAGQENGPRRRPHVPLASGLSKRYRFSMSVWNDLNDNLKQTSRQWLDWAKQHAQEVGEAGIRHIERQDLLSERKQIVHRVGEAIVDRFLVEEKKTVRSDSPGVGDLLERITRIDDRLQELSDADRDEDADKS
jgi:hypothetical protein